MGGMCLSFNDQLSAWQVSEAAGSGGYFLISDGPAEKPTDCVWSKARVVEANTLMPKSGTIPAVIIMDSKWSNFRGGFKLMDQKHELYPVFRGRTADGVRFFCHDLVAGSWMLKAGGCDNNQYLWAASSKALHPAAISIPGDIVFGDHDLFTLSELSWSEHDPKYGHELHIDNGFPADARSINVRSQERAKFDSTSRIEWIRAMDLNRDDPDALLERGASVFHPKQGAIGDCWLITAMSSLAHHAGFVNNVFCRKLSLLMAGTKCVCGMCAWVRQALGSSLVLTITSLVSSVGSMERLPTLSSQHPRTASYGRFSWRRPSRSSVAIMATSFRVYHRLRGRLLQGLSAQAWFGSKIRRMEDGERPLMMSLSSEGRSRRAIGERWLFMAKRNWMQKRRSTSLFSIARMAL